MYCKRCYTELPAEDPGDVPMPMVADPNQPLQLSYARRMDDRCSKCGKRFNRGRPRSYLSRPFPSTRRFVFTLIVTTAFGLFVAMVVALGQMPAMQAGGH